MSEIYIFNPEHDLALANDDANFNAPQSAVQLARDLSCLPLWYAPNKSTIIAEQINEKWLAKMGELFPQIALTNIYTTLACNNATSFHPWGWDKAILKKLTKLCKNTENIGATTINNSLPLPDEKMLEKITELSHRRNAIIAHRYLIERVKSKKILRNTAIEIKGYHDLISYVIQMTPSVYKAPWSGSGKGLCWTRTDYTVNDANWCSNIIDKQKSIIAENIYDVVRDFAMTFSCKQQKAVFEGFSVFEAEAGIYRCNSLMDEASVVNMLQQYKISSNDIDEVKNTLLAFIESEIAPHYDGILGVDMFIFKSKNIFKWHPCVEINLRTTMGYVSKCVFDNIVANGSRGRFYIDYFKTPSKLHKNHEEKQANQPLKIIDNKVVSGYLSLTPIYETTEYRASIEIFE